MKCKEAKLKIDEYIMGNISKKTSNSLDEHIENCNDCKKMKDTYSFVWEQLGTISIECPEDMKNRLFNNIENLTKPIEEIKPAANTYIFSNKIIWAASILTFITLFFLYSIDNSMLMQVTKLHLKTEMPKNFRNENDIIKEFKDKLNLEIENIAIKSEVSLISGKICYLDKKVIGQLIYQYQGIPISLFIWDSRWQNKKEAFSYVSREPKIFKKKSQSLIIWENRQKVYCLVSSLQTWELGAIFGLPIEIKYPILK